MERVAVPEIVPHSKMANSYAGVMDLDVRHPENWIDMRQADIPQDEGTSGKTLVGKTVW